MRNDSQTNKGLTEITVRDETWSSYVQDRLDNEDRDGRNLLIAARVLRFLRQEGHTKAWLAEQMGISPQRVSVILKGRGNMTTVSIGQLEKATGLSLFVVPTEEPTALTQPKRQSAFQGVLSAATGYTIANFLAPTPGNSRIAL